MKAIQSMESEMRDVNTNQKKIILQQNFLKNNSAPAISEKASNVFPDSPKSNKEDHKSCFSPTNNQVYQNLQTKDVKSNLNETEMNYYNLNLELAKLSQHIKELYIKFNIILAAVAKLEFSIDELEQYGRRNCIILHGLDNFPNVHTSYDEFLHKVINTLNHHLNLRLDIG